MKHTLPPLLCLAFILPLPACQSCDDPAPAVSPPISEEGSAEGSAVAEAEEAPAAHPRGPLPDAPCPELLNLVWSDFSDAIERVGVEAPESLRDRYDRTMEANEFAARCEALERTEHECLWVSGNVLTGIASCGINLEREADRRLIPPALMFFIRPPRPELPLAEQEQLMARLVGSWADTNDRERWTVEPDGSAVISWRRGPNFNDVPMQLAFVERHQLSRTNPANNRGQTAPFLFDGDDAFYHSQNAAFGTYAFGETGAWTVEAESDWIVVERDGDFVRCDVFGRFGERIENATCGFEEGGELVARYTTPGDILGGGPGVARERRFLPVGDRLVHGQITRYERVTPEAE